MPDDILNAFLPAVRRWFRQTLGTPTPPQQLGWPAICRGEHTLILSPTGSGKTLAAFLSGINDLYARQAAGEDEEGVQLLYISPLKALNNDIERNLRAPLLGIRQAARELGDPLPPLRVMVRTGDTPTNARASMVRHPPHILITTPESLYLILTSVRAREMLRHVRTVIVDEIHTLVGAKRGVHLALSLERLATLADGPIQRIGLSATQRPLDEVARFLGGYEWQGEELVPRPVTLVDAGMRKPLDLQVVTVVRDLRQLPGGSAWSSIIPRILDMILRHRTTLVFANSRRQAERAADRLNEQFAAEQSEEIEPGSTEALSPGGVPKGIGFLGTGATDGPFRAHHGSISREMRLQLETDLKEGRLPALIGTSSLELGIDIGAVDLVVQLQSPKGIARGLQRVGRSGHLVGQTSVGRILPTHSEDVMESAAVARGMLEGDVEPTYAPQNCLDVLAQQIVAMTAVDEWEVDALYRVARRAYPYYQLSYEAYTAVLDMLSGKYPSTAFRELRPRIVWDRVHNRLRALPGSHLLALRNGGTIPDRGNFGVYLPDRTTRLGELDEEFVFETHPGDVFSLGTQVWRVLDVTEDRVVVSEAAGQIPRMPFWKGDVPYRDYHLGLRVGAFRRELAERVEALATLPEAAGSDWPDEGRALIEWLGREYALDENSARNAITYTQRQLESLGAISSDRTVILESFTDALGDERLVVHSCFGGRINSAWALAIRHAMRERVGVSVEVQTSDDGMLFRLPQADRALPTDAIREMTPAEARERLLMELPGSALFGAQFRVNAARALLLPGTQGTRKRTPFWLQRLRAKDLLAAAQGLEDFPLIAETYRDCLRDILDLRHLQEVLARIQAGEIRVIEAETIVPSPVAANLLFNFMSVYIYEGDAPKLERQMQALALDRRLLSQLLDGVELADLLRPEAVREVEGQISRTAEGYRARNADELSVFLAEAGDLTTEELLARSAGDGAAWVTDLAAEGRIIALELPTGRGSQRRWVPAEQAEQYRAAFGIGGVGALLAAPPTGAAQERGGASAAPTNEAAYTILTRYLRQRGPLTRQELLARYAFPEAWLDETLATLEESGEIVAGRLVGESHEPQLADRHVLERIRQRTLIMLRKEIQPVSLSSYADFLTRWQHLHPDEQLTGPSALVKAIQQLRGVAAPGLVWERDLLPLRVRDYHPLELEALAEKGDLVWIGSGGKDPRRARVRFLFRGEGSLFLPPEPTDSAELSEDARRVWELLKSEGASFASDLQRGTNLDERRLSAALSELVMAGIVTNDHLAALRDLLTRAPSGDGQRAPLSSLEAELAAWRREHPRATPHRSDMLRARRVASRRVLHDQHESAGRWSLVHRLGIWGAPATAEERAERQARQLLARYGIVTRASLEHEEEWDWPGIYTILSLLEMRGEVRRGYFVQGLPGMQFATTEALERLRGWNAALAADPAGGALVLVNATDPANLFASDAALEAGDARAANPLKLSRLSGNYYVLWRGRPLLAIANSGERIWASADAAETQLRDGLRLFLAHVSEPGGLATGTRRLLVAEWNGEPVLSSPAQPLLESLGFYREPPQMAWDERGL